MGTDMSFACLTRKRPAEAYSPTNCELGRGLAGATLLGPLPGTAPATSIPAVGRLLAGLFQAIAQNHLGVRRRPAVGDHLVETRIVSMQPYEYLPQVGPRFEAVSLGAGYNGEQRLGARPACSVKGVG